MTRSAANDDHSAGLPPLLHAAPSPPQSGQSAQSSWLTKIVVLLAWTTSIGLAAIAGLHFFFHDGVNVLIWLNAFTRYIYLPAYLCLAFALAKRRWWLAALNLAVVGCHVFWVAPDFMRDGRFGAARTVADANDNTPSHVRIFFANVCHWSTEYDSMLREIEAADPDIVALVEFDMPWRKAFRNSPMMAKYHHGNWGDAWHGCDVTVFSKIPLENHVERYFADRFMESFDVLLGSQQFHLICLHSPRPMNLYLNDYEGFWKRAVRQIAHAPRPLVVVGDCNATQYSLVYDQVKETGLHSAHEECGRGYATTWPNGTLPAPPIRIDQAFLSDEVECVRIEEGIGRGSDHKPLILDVRVRAVVSPQMSSQPKQ